jgi:prevent-host-death family protein
MPVSVARNIKSPSRRSRAIDDLERWKLEDAKARLSEVVRLASTNGPQLVTVRGREAAIILAPEGYRQLLPKPRGHQPLAEFLQGLGQSVGLSEAELDRLDLTREPDTGRELNL